MEWAESLNKEARKVEAEYGNLVEQRAQVQHKIYKTTRELEMLNNLLTYHGKERVQINTG